MPNGLLQPQHSRESLALRYQTMSRQVQTRLIRVRAFPRPGGMNSARRSSDAHFSMPQPMVASDFIIGVSRNA